MVLSLVQSRSAPKFSYSETCTNSIFYCEILLFRNLESAKESSPGTAVYFCEQYCHRVIVITRYEYSRISQKQYVSVSSRILLARFTAFVKRECSLLGENDQHPNYCHVQASGMVMTRFVIAGFHLSYG